MRALLQAWALGMAPAALAAASTRRQKRAAAEKHWLG
jgi:hypothetical protein